MIKAKIKWAIIKLDGHKEGDQLVLESGEPLSQALDQIIGSVETVFKYERGDRLLLEVTGI